MIANTKWPLVVALPPFRQKPIVLDPERKAGEVLRVGEGARDKGGGVALSAAFSRVDADKTFCPPTKVLLSDAFEDFCVYDIVPVLVYYRLG